MDKVTEAKRIPIEDYLNSIGYTPVSGKRTGKYLYYFSMFRNEKVPSFCVDRGRNRWADFGMSVKWEDVISLVQTIENLSFPKALNRLLGEKSSYSATVIKSYSKPGIEIVDIFPLRNPKLFDYLVGRNIDVDLARIYCKEALVIFPFGKNPKKKHSYIAFRNDKGGYELRNHYGIQMAKVSSRPKYFTRILGEENKYNFFEGFIDYLSLLGQYKREKFKNTTVVLNSLVNIVYLHQTMKENEENNLFLNNDEAADKYIFKGDPKMKIESLKDLGIHYIDHREMFKEANDINDYINGKIFF